jgi:hypothetical protein
MTAKWNQNHPRLQGFFLALGVLAALLSLNISAHASVIVDGGFEAAGGGNTYYAGQYIDPTDSWYVKTGAVYIDSDDPWVYDGNNSLNLTYANLYAPDTVTQTFATVVGQIYDISFWANADTPNAFAATENGLAIAGLPTSIVDNGFPNPTNSSLFVDYSGHFTATSTTTTLQLTSTADPAILSGDGSVMIDDLTVITPEPSSIVLMLTGMLGLGFAAARKRLATAGRAI